jgi:hypothetical protein
MLLDSQLASWLSCELTSDMLLSADGRTESGRGCATMLGL